MLVEKGKKWIGVTLVLLIFVTSLFGCIVYYEFPENEIAPISSIEEHDSFIDDVFINNLINYQDLMINGDMNLTSADIFLPEKVVADKTEDNYTVEMFNDLMLRNENDYYFPNMSHRTVVDFFAENKNNRIFSADLSDLKNNQNTDLFAWYIILEYDANGKLSYTHASDKFVERATSKYFNASLMDYEDFNFEPIIQNGVLSQNDKIKVNPIKSTTFIYAISNENFELLKNGLYFPYYDNDLNNTARDSQVIIFVISNLTIGVLSLLIAVKHIKEIKLYKTILNIPFELLVVLLALAFSFYGLVAEGVFTTLEYGIFSSSTSDMLHILGQLVDIAIATGIMSIGLFITSFIVYAFKNIFYVGFIDYFKYKSIVGMVCLKSKKGIKELTELTLDDDMSKKIAKIMIINACIILIACIFWWLGIILMFIYNIYAYLFVLRKYQAIRSNYTQLNQYLDEISQGHLDVDVSADMGVFNNMKEKLVDIKSGFKSAVEEEVKSQKMKTELISNVSHDLKTPLTTLISYIDLLQHDDLTEEERKRYIQILDGSSLRLKRCIDDLFEISKVESGNVSCHLVNVNLVDLMKQTQFELSDKIEKSSLEFRVKMPENKVVCSLDSSKTYRILENLYINIIKYALPNSRVYVDLTEDEEWAHMGFKNISAKEITYTGSDLTERFVRNDASRNSEGSGLGLAIAKSFTELMGGKFNVEIEGDYFKVFMDFKKETSINTIVEPVIVEEEINPVEEAEEVIKKEEEIVDETEENN